MKRKTKVTKIQHDEFTTQQLMKFFVTNNQTLSAAAYEAFPDLHFDSTEKIVEVVVSKFNEYMGPITESDFLKWATRIAQKEALRYKITESILAEYSRVIHAAIHRATNGVATELYVGHEDIYWEVVLLIFQKAHALNRKGTAKLSTRLTSLVKKHVDFYHKSYWDRRHRLNREHLESCGEYGVEIADPEPPDSDDRDETA